MKMKEFNDEQAKAGKRVVTRGGSNVRIRCFDRVSDNYPIVALIDIGAHESVETHTARGKHQSNGCESSYDLFMASEKKEGWINVYPSEGGYIHDTEAEALESRRVHAIDTIKIEWSE